MRSSCALRYGPADVLSRVKWYLSDAEIQELLNSDSDDSVTVESAGPSGFVSGERSDSDPLGAEKFAKERRLGGTNLTSSAPKRKRGCPIKGEELAHPKGRHFLSTIPLILPCVHPK